MGQMKQEKAIAELGVPPSVEFMLARGIRFKVDGQTLYALPGKLVTNNDRELIQVLKPRIMDLVQSGELMKDWCSGCSQRLKQGKCWRCHYRPCERCGRGTGSAFLAYCIGCESQGN